MAAETRPDYLTVARGYVAAYEAAIHARAASTSASGTEATPILVSDSP